MKSKNNTSVEVKKCLNLGHIPLFVSMAQRHFEKAAVQEGGSCSGTTYTFSLPVDLLRLSISEETLSSVESIEFSYSKRG